LRLPAAFDAADCRFIFEHLLPYSDAILQAQLDQMAADARRDVLTARWLTDPALVAQEEARLTYGIGLQNKCKGGCDE
jgi:hypothetical protein